VTLYVAFVPTPGPLVYKANGSLQIEVSDAQGELLYFVIRGPGERPPGSRVGVDLGAQTCELLSSSGTGIYNQGFHDALVTIDDVPLGSFPMAQTQTMSLDGKSFDIDNRLSVAITGTNDYASFGIIGRASP